MSFSRFKFFWHLQAYKVLFITHCTILGSYQDANSDKMYQVKLEMRMLREEFGSAALLVKQMHK